MFITGCFHLKMQKSVSAASMQGGFLLGLRQLKNDIKKKIKTFIIENI